MSDIDANGVADPFSLRFAGWLATCWRDDGPREPLKMPEAIRTTYRGVHLIHWYVRGDTIYRYAPGARGCYAVPAFGLHRPGNVDLGMRHAHDRAAISAMIQLGKESDRVRADPPGTVR